MTRKKHKTKKTASARKKKEHARRTHKRTHAQPKRGVFGRFLKWCFVLGLWVSIGLGALIAWYAAELPDITEAMIFERRPTITVKAHDGTVLDRYGDIKGNSIAIEDLPPYVANAVLAIEDRRFYNHFGLDPMGVARAMVVNVKGMSFIQGGSTITQQLAKNLFLSRDRTLKRKIQEAMLAVWLERTLSKDEILSAYMNRVYLGSGAYGIDAASKVYFNKSAKELTLREAATIAGLLKAPSRYSPSIDPERSARRTETVLQAMVDAGYIEQAEIDALGALPPSPRRKPSSGDTVRYFTDYVVARMNDLIGPVGKDIIIETTLDKDIQEESESAVTRALLSTTDKNVSQGAAIVLRLDGAIMAMVGGRDYGMSEFNRVTHSFRPPGSSFKPFVYLTALEQGWKIDDTIVDEPITRGRYRPQNFGHEYMGEVTLLEALTNSLNTVSVNLMREVSPEEVISTARRLGITADLEPNLSLALGSSGIPVIEMATAYATLGRGGLAVEPFAILRIMDEEGTVYYEHPRQTSFRQVVARQNVEDLTKMMQSVIENGTGLAARLPWPAAGKTGTSQDFRDAWFIGFTNRYAAAVWMGNDDNTPTKRVTGGSAPARAWREIMLTAHKQGGPAPAYNAPVSSGGSFHDLISRLLGGQALPESNRRDTSRPESEEYTPLGRHQWDLND